MVHQLDGRQVIAVGQEELELEALGVLDGLAVGEAVDDVDDSALLAEHGTARDLGQYQRIDLASRFDLGHQVGLQHVGTPESESKYMSIDKSLSLSLALHIYTTISFSFYAHVWVRHIR